MVKMTLCFLLYGSPPDKVLLGQKKTGFGKGKYYGFGGKVEQGESITQATVREVAEESSISVAEAALLDAGQVYFFAQPTNHNIKLTATLLQEKQELDEFGPKSVAYLFAVLNSQGMPQESNEMIPTWFSLDAVPYFQMWPTDQTWMEPVLAGQRVQAAVTTLPNGERVSEVQVVGRWMP